MCSPATSAKPMSCRKPSFVIFSVWVGGTRRAGSSDGSSEVVLLLMLGRAPRFCSVTVLKPPLCMWSLLLCLICIWAAVSAHTVSGVHRRKDEVPVQEVYRMGVWSSPLLAVRHQLHRHGPTQFSAGNSHLRERCSGKLAFKNDKSKHPVVVL